SERVNPGSNGNYGGEDCEKQTQKEETIMISEQNPYTVPPIEERPPIPVPPAARKAVPEYNEQYTELLAQQLIPRLMPEILYHLRAVDPARERNRAFGMSLALA